MTALKSKLLEAIKTKKINVFLLFVFLAFIILVLSKLSMDYTNTIRFSLNYKNVPEEVVILDDPSKKIEVTLRTYGFKWLKHYLTKSSLAVDFINDVTKTDSVYIWSSSKGYSSLNNQFDKKEKIISINPDTLRFKYDKNAVKYVPVNPKITINYSPGFNALNDKIVNPDSIKLIGPSSLLNEINTISTKVFKADDVKAPILKILELNLDSLDKTIKVFPKTVQLTTNVEKFTEGVLNIPIEVINVPKKISLVHFPKSINVYYSTSLKLFNEINKSDFKVVCDYEELSNNKEVLKPKLVKQPTNVKYTRMQKLNVEFIITK